MKILRTMATSLVALSIATSVMAQTSPPLLPNPTLTPGAVRTDVTLAQVCAHGYTAGMLNGQKVRDVSASLKAAVFKRYHIDPKSGAYEIDHLISLENFGSNDITNLWPQAYFTKPYNAHIKDHLEDYLHHHMCIEKDMTPQQVRAALAPDWIASYRKYFCVGPKQPQDGTCPVTPPVKP